MRFTDKLVFRRDDFLSALGEEWFETMYPKISVSLGYEQSGDERTRDLLSELLSRRKKHVSPAALSSLIKGKTAIMFGAGPSLASDIKGIASFIEKRNPLVVAADGAADALYDSGITPSIIVSDLDSCSEKNLVRNSNEGYVFVHAHGDNYWLVETIVPRLEDKISGTTQVASTSSVVNYGGLTDGDRACFILSSSDPKIIIIAGMDLGEKEGEFSKSRQSSATNPQRANKLAWGKASIEFLVRRRPDIRFLNVTKYGQEISAIPKVSYEQLTSTVS
jgi:2-amino-4-hydroxy-6-hydroxymethyldihydropteridine diphosphokinase